VVTIVVVVVMPLPDCTIRVRFPFESYVRVLVSWTPAVTVVVVTVLAVSSYVIDSVDIAALPAAVTVAAVGRPELSQALYVIVEFPLEETAVLRLSRFRLSYECVTVEVADPAVPV